MLSISKIISSNIVHERANVTENRTCTNMLRIYKIKIIIIVITNIKLKFTVIKYKNPHFIIFEKLSHEKQPTKPKEQSLDKR